MVMLPPTLTGVTSRVMGQWASEIYGRMDWESPLWWRYCTAEIRGQTQSVVYFN